MFDDRILPHGCPPMSDKRRWLEYDTDSGVIVCEVISPAEPVAGDGRSVIEIDMRMHIDVHACAVRDGKVVRIYETPAERAERERLHKEHRERARRRMDGVLTEFQIALIEDDAERQERLKEEWKRLKRCL